MKRTKGIQQKFTRLILYICIAAILIASICSCYTMINMRSKALDNAKSDAKAQLTDLAKNKAIISDSMLHLAENQTLLVAKGMYDVLENKESCLLGYHENDLPNLTCSEGYTLGEYSVHVRVPEALLKNTVRNDEGTVTYAELNRDVNIGELTVNQELYLSSLIKSEFSQIERFKDEDGTYKGFAASYFCFDDSGIDVLGDPLTTAMIEYDGRERGWYQGAVKAFYENTLTDSGVYWTEPVQDASGRGISLICSAPVVVNGKVAGVAGSGGLLVNFADLVETAKIGDTGFSFMVSRNTTKVIINPNTTERTSLDSEVMIETDLSQSQNQGLVDLAAKIKNNESGLVEHISIDGEDCYAAYYPLTNNEWTMVTVISTNDSLIMSDYDQLNSEMFKAITVFFILVAVLIVLIVFVSGRFSKTLTRPIIELKEGVDRIGEGELDFVLDIKTGDEIEELGNSFNHMAKNLDSYIKNLATVTAEKERIGAELDVAAHIQSSMLPCIFPAFPDRKEIDIYATMTPAKEVGGDFYDFFMIDKRHVAIVMADVSGKGVPAALFMVIGKTLLKDHSQAKKDPGEVFTTVNNLLCEANSEGLFITAFEGVLDMVTGEFVYVNAGHEMPFICKKGGKFAPHKIKPGFVLAGIEDMVYKSGSITIEPGDKIFQYTDGVTEATNANKELYGMERLENILSTVSDKKPEEILPAIKQDIDSFVGEADQFDDITMLCLEFRERMEEE